MLQQRAWLRQQQVAATPGSRAVVARHLSLNESLALGKSARAKG